MNDPLRLLVYFRGRVAADQGTPLRCRNLTDWLAREPAVETLLVSRDAPDEARRVLPHVRHHPAATAESGLPELRRAVAAFSPHVIHAHTHKGMADLARLERGGGLHVADLHGDLPAWRLEHTWRPWIWRRYWHLRERIRERRSLPRMDAFTVVSSPLEDRVRKLGKPVLRLWGGVDPELFSSSDVPEPDGYTIAYAGNFHPYHGIETVLTAAVLAREEVPHLRLRLIGDADAFPEVARRARALLGDRVELTGKVPYAEVPRLLGEAHVLVIPRARTRTAETTYPSKLSEYLAIGRPVVAAAVGEVRAVIRDGDNGILVEPESADDLARAFRRLTDRPLRQRIGAAGRATACNELSWPRIAARAFDFFRSHAGRGSDSHESP